MKKKNVIRPSLIRCLTVSSKVLSPNVKPTWESSKAQYVSAHGELAHRIAATVHASSSAAAVFSFVPGALGSRLNRPGSRRTIRGRGSAVTRLRCRRRRSRR